MTKQEIIAKVNELIAAPSVCAPVKSAAEAYLKKQDKASADALVKVLSEEAVLLTSLSGFASLRQAGSFSVRRKLRVWLRRPRSRKLRAGSIAYVLRSGWRSYLRKQGSSCVSIAC
ncbi:MAG: hypothetical protein IJU26_04220 [Synergistaceae bacterium]|nr:hypothetical protein [Synergistaceae bacterium]